MNKTAQQTIDDITEDLGKAKNDLALAVNKLKPLEKTLTFAEDWNTLKVIMDYVREARDKTEEAVEVLDEYNVKWRDQGGSQ